MRKPPRFWEKTFASLGFGRREEKKRAAARATRLMSFEALEPRHLLTALLWDPAQSGGASLGGSGTWDGTSAAWYDQSAGADVAWGSGDTAVFEGQPGAVAISGQINAASIVFNTTTGGAGYSLSGDSLTLPSAGTTIEVDNDPATISSIIAGAGGLTTTGTGTLIISGANTYTGGTTLAGGVLNFTTGSLPINAVAPNITFAGGTLQWAAGNTDDVSAGIAPIPAGQSATLDTNGNDVTFCTPLSGDGGLTKLGNGTLFLAANDTCTGTGLIMGGSVQLAGAANPTLVVATPSDLTAPFTPAQVRGAYGISSLPSGDTGAGQTIAIVDAFDDNHIASEAAEFNSKYNIQQFGGSGPTLTVDNLGAASGSAWSVQNEDAAWGYEICLDVEWAHAIAPEANIVLVEAKDMADADLAAAAATAATLHNVSVVSMSWGDTEANWLYYTGKSETNDDGDFTQPGVTFLAATGDDGGFDIYGNPEGLYPAFSPNVVAVGGTSLAITNSNTYGGESYWDDDAGAGGYGTSTVESEPKYQDSAQSSDTREIPDVSFDADPDTGVHVYTNKQGWMGIGGTSLATPCWAGLIAIANQMRAANGLAPLSGATQTLPALYAIPSTDFNKVGESPYDPYNGLGTPVANLLVPALGNPALPTVATAASASPATVTATTTTLKALGADAIWGQADLTYEWSATGPATPTFSANGTNAAKNATATFDKAGSYVFKVTITNTLGAWATSSVNVTVNQTATTITVTPPAGQTSTVNVGATVQFTATATDQFGNAMTTSFTWATTGGVGTISASGLLTAPDLIGTGTAADTVAGTVTARVDGTATGTYNLTVTNSVTLSSGAKLEVDTGETLTVHGITFGSGGGTVQVDNGGTLDLAGLTGTTGTVAFVGGTLEAGAAFTSAVPINIGSGGGTVNTNGYDVTLSGDISDPANSGELVKTGTGTLTLSGTNTYTGGTTTEGGTLIFSQPSAAPSTGILTVNSGGMVVLGSSTTDSGGQTDDGGQTDSYTHGGQSLNTMGNGNGNGGGNDNGGTTAGSDVVEFYLQPISQGATNYTTDFQMDGNDNITANNVATSDASGTIYFAVYAGLNQTNATHADDGVQWAELNFTSTGTIGSQPSSLGLALENGFGDFMVASTGASADLNGDGNLDLGSTNNSSPAGWAVFCQNTGVFATGSGAAAGAGDRTNILLGVLAYNYTSASPTDAQTAQVTLDSRGGGIAVPVFDYELDGVVKCDTFSGSHASDLAIGTPVTITYTPSAGENDAVVVGGSMVGSSASAASAASVASAAAPPVASCLAVPVASAAATASPPPAGASPLAASPATVAPTAAVSGDSTAAGGGAGENAAAADLGSTVLSATAGGQNATVAAADEFFATLGADSPLIAPSVALEYPLAV
jgi:autotransporter-associated beta strand protein